MRDQERSPESERRANERREQTWIKLGLEPPSPERSPDSVTPERLAEIRQMASAPDTYAPGDWWSATKDLLEALAVLGRQLAEKDEALRRIADPLNHHYKPDYVRPEVIAREALRAEPAKEPRG